MVKVQFQMSIRKNKSIDERKTQLFLFSDLPYPYHKYNFIVLKILLT